MEEMEDWGPNYASLVLEIKGSVYKPRYMCDT